MTSTANQFPHIDSAAFSTAFQGLFSLSTLAHLLSALPLVVLALVISLPSAHASAAIFKKSSPWLRWPLRILTQVLAFFPLTALSLGTAGHLAGTLGWPLPSLMPTEYEPGLASWLWYWTLPLSLLCIPVYAWVFSCLLASDARPRRILAGAAALTGAGVLMLADTLTILPSMATPARALLTAEDGAFLQSICQGMLLALSGMLLTGFWPVPVKRHPMTIAAQIREGAIVIGLSPRQIWWRHQMPMRIRPSFALLFDIGAWSVALAGAWGIWLPLPFLTELQSAGSHWLEQPAHLLATAAPVALCSLSLWLAARIIHPGST